MSLVERFLEKIRKSPAVTGAEEAAAAAGASSPPQAEPLAYPVGVADSVDNAVALLRSGAYSPQEAAEWLQHCHPDVWPASPEQTADLAAELVAESNERL